MKIRGALPWILAAILVAIVTHVVALLAVPRIAMSRVVSQFGVPNVVHLGTRPGASSRGVVRPSTDLLYALCPYDLSLGGTLVVNASLPEPTHWFVAAYDADTNNFFVRDDRLQNGPFHLSIVGPDTLARAGNRSKVIRSPTRHGIVIIRILIDDEAHLARLIAAQHTANCLLEK